MRVYEEGGQGKVYTKRVKGKEGDRCSEWMKDFRGREFRDGGREAFFHDLPLQMLMERERERMLAELDKQRRTVEEVKKDLQKRARMQRTLYRPPSHLRVA
jgi:hypothetical protein